jgi:predicted peptidase
MFARVVLVIAALGCGSAEPSNPGTVPPGSVVAPVVGFSKRTSAADGITIPYQAWAPQDFVVTRRWPIVVALAGTGERGNDGDKQVTVGMGPLVQSQPNFPAVVVFPQIPSDESGRLAFDKAIYQIVNDVIRDYNGDPDRVYLAGLSYGGTEAFNLLYGDARPFAAFVSAASGICARCIQNGASLDAAHTLVAQKLKTFPIWMFQGDQDTSSPVANARGLRDAFQAAGATSFKYTEYAGADHLIWDRVYATPAVWDWVFAQRR